jgi:hypothetical protein
LLPARVALPANGVLIFAAGSFASCLLVQVVSLFADWQKLRGWHSPLVGMGSKSVGPLKSTVTTTRCRAIRRWAPRNVRFPMGSRSESAEGVSLEAELSLIVSSRLA